MGKFVAIILSTCMAMLLVAAIVGPSLSKPAFHITGLGVNVSYGMVVGSIMGALMWRIIRGKK